MDIQTSLVYFTNDNLLSGKSPKTIKGYEHSLTLLLNFIKISFIPQQMVSLTYDTLSKFMVDGIKVKKWSRYTVWTHHKNLNCYFNWCLKRQLIAKNPLEGIAKPRLPVQPPKALTEQEMIEVLRCVANMPNRYHFTTIRNKAFITLLFMTGLRKQEALDLKIEDVDIQNRLIEVRSGKGGKRRQVPIEEMALLPVLIEYLQHRDRLAKNSPWFFTGTFEGRGHYNGKMSVTTSDRLFRTITKTLKKRVYAHKCRHSFATLLLDRTGDLFTLKELLGHSSVKTTTIYLSSTIRKKQSVINQINLSI